MAGAQLAFAAMGVSAHWAIRYVAPVHFAAVRITLGLPGLAWLAHREGARLTWRVVAWGVPLAAGMVGAQVLVFVCNAQVGAAPTSALQPAMPVFVALFSWAARLEAMSARKAAGVAASVGGALAIAWPEDNDWGDASVPQYALLVFQVSLYAVYLVALGVAMRDCGRSPFLFLYVSTLLGWLVLMPAATPSLLRADLRAVPWAAWAACAYAGLGVTLVAHAANSWAVSKVLPTVPSLYNGLQVVGAFVGSAAFLGERLTVQLVVGTLMIGAGVVVVCTEDTRGADEVGAGGARFSTSASGVGAAFSLSARVTRALGGKLGGRLGGGRAPASRAADGRGAHARLDSMAPADPASDDCEGVALMACEAGGVPAASASA